MKQTRNSDGIAKKIWLNNLHPPDVHPEKWVTDPITIRELKLYGESIKNPTVRLLFHQVGGYGETPKWCVSSFRLSSNGDIVKMGTSKHGFLLLTQRGREKKYASLDAALADWQKVVRHGGVTLNFPGATIY